MRLLTELAGQLLACQLRLLRPPVYSVYTPPSFRSCVYATIVNRLPIICIMDKGWSGGPISAFEFTKLTSLF